MTTFYYLQWETRRFFGEGGLLGRRRKGAGETGSGIRFWIWVHGLVGWLGHVLLPFVTYIFCTEHTRPICTCMNSTYLLPKEQFPLPYARCTLPAFLLPASALLLPLPAPFPLPAAWRASSPDITPYIPFTLLPCLPRAFACMPGYTIPADAASRASRARRRCRCRAGPHGVTWATTVARR